MHGEIDTFVYDFNEFIPSEVLDLNYDTATDLFAILRPNEVQLVRLSDFSPVRSIPLGAGKEPRRVFFGREATLLIVFAGSKVEVRSLTTFAWRQTLIVDAQALIGAAYARGYSDDEEYELLAVAAYEGYTTVFRNESTTCPEFHMQCRYAHSRGQQALSCVLHLLEGLILTGYSNGEIRANTLKGSSMRWYSVLSSAVWALAASTEVLAAGCANGELNLLDWKTGSILHLFDSSVATVKTIVCDEGRIFFSGADSRIFFLTREENGWIHRDKTRGQSHDVNTLMLHPSGNILLSAGKNTDVCFLPLAPRGFATHENDRKRHESYVPQNLVYHCNQGLLGLIHGEAVRLLRIGDETPAQKMFELRTREAIAHAAITADGQLLAVASESRSHIRIYNTTDSKLIATLAGIAQRLCFITDELLFFDTEVKEIRSFSAQSKFKTMKIQKDEVLQGLEHVDRLCVDATRVLLADNLSCTLVLFNYRRKKCTDISHLLRGKGYTLIEFGENDNELFVLRKNLCLYSYNICTGAIRKRLSTVCSPLLKPIRNLLFVGEPSSLILQSTKKILRIVPDDAERTTVINRKSILFLGRGPGGSVLSVEIDWKNRVSKQLGLPVNTRKFVSASRLKTN